MTPWMYDTCDPRNNSGTVPLRHWRFKLYKECDGCRTSLMCTWLGVKTASL